MKRLLVLLITGITFALATYAYAGIYDRFNDFRHWIFPAYLYCLIFGVLFMVVFGGVAYAMRKRITPKLERLTQFLRKSPFWSIIVWGVLFAIPLGILGNVLYLIFWFLVCDILGILLIIYPVLLSSKHFRNACSFYPSFLKWNIILVMSAVCASVLFIILTKCGWLISADEYILLSYEIIIHPYDSIRNIWNSVPVFLFFIILSLILYWIGHGLRALFRYLISFPYVNRLWVRAKGALYQIFNVRFLRKIR